MNNLITTFQDRFSDWTVALGQHLQLSLLALLISIMIAVPLAVLLSSRKRAAGFVLQVAGIFQTIPSLALLGLFIPLMGIGTVPALTTSFNNIGVVCFIPNFAKYDYRSTRN